jgi:hypothetical protein
LEQNQWRQKAFTRILQIDFWSSNAALTSYKVSFAARRAREKEVCTTFLAAMLDHVLNEDLELSDKSKTVPNVMALWMALSISIIWQAGSLTIRFEVVM